MGEPRGRKKPDDSQVLRMGVFQVAFLGECLVIFLEKCLEWEGECLECWESLGSVKFVVIQRSCIAGSRSYGGLPGCDPEPGKYIKISEQPKG